MTMTVAAPIAPSNDGRTRHHWAIRDGLVIARRNLWQIPRNPQLLGFSTIQPIMFVVLFAYVFAPACASPRMSRSWASTTTRTRPSPT
jgi:hypothetical protein